MTKWITKVKKLVKHGDSYVLVIDKPTRDMLRITPETPLDLKTEGECLIVTPLRKHADEMKFRQAVGKIHQHFGRAMKKLAR